MTEIELNLLAHSLHDHDTIHEVKREWFFNQEYQKIFDIIQKQYTLINKLTLFEIVGLAKKAGINQKAINDFYTYDRSFDYVEVDLKEAADNYFKIKETEHLKWALKSRMEDPNHSYLKVMAFYENELPNSEEYLTSHAHQTEKLMAQFEKGISTIGLPLGLTSIDKSFGGFKPCNVYVIAARPGAGKTAMACYLAHKHAVEDKVKTLFVSLEMTAFELTKRINRIDAGLPSDFFDQEIEKVHTEPLTKFYSCLVNHQNSTLQYLENVHTVTGISAYCWKVKPQLLIIDYIQLIQSLESDRVPTHEKYKLIMKGLKTIAKRFNMPVIGLAQINRTGEEKPKNSDLKDSGWIEQVADGIFLLSRTTLEDKTERIDLILSKNREYGTTIECHPKFVRGKYVQ